VLHNDQPGCRCCQSLSLPLLLREQNADGGCRPTQAFLIHLPGCHHISGHFQRCTACCDHLLLTGCCQLLLLLRMALRHNSTATVSLLLPLLMLLLLLMRRRHVPLLSIPSWKQQINGGCTKLAVRAALACIGLLLLDQWPRR
jgi:hypothetical protein